MEAVLREEKSLWLEGFEKRVGFEPEVVSEGVVDGESGEPR